MKVLVRDIGDGTSKWCDARFRDGHIQIKVTSDGCWRETREDNIISITGDVRKKYIYCPGCGKYFKKGSKQYEEHKKFGESSEACFKCNRLREQIIHTKSRKYVLQENGTYISTTKAEAHLLCTINWRDYDINSQEAREYCIYKKCKTSNPQEVDAFFLKYPGAFDEIITVDRIIDAGYKSVHSNFCGAAYQLKGRQTILACVNKSNIVTYFQLKYDGDSWFVYYSKKYDKFFVTSGGTYKELNTCYPPSSTLEAMKNKIRNLYN